MSEPTIPSGGRPLSSSDDPSLTPPRYAERSLGRLILRYRADAFPADRLDELADRAQRLASYIDKRLRPLAGVNRDFEPLTVLLETETAVAAALFGSDQAAVQSGLAGQVLVTPDTSAREFDERLALVLVQSRLGGPELWEPPRDQADAEAVASALQFLGLGLALHFATEAERRDGGKLFASTSGAAPRQSPDQVCRQVAIDRDGKVPLYECLMRGPGLIGTPPEYAALAESFCGYLFEREGPKTYRRFVLGCRQNPNEAADLLYGKSLEELQDEWLGAILRGQGRRPVSLLGFGRQVLPYLRPYVWMVVLALALMFLGAGVAQIAPFAIRDIIDILSAQNIRENPNDTLVQLYAKLAILALAAFVNLGSIVWLVYTVEVIGQNILRDLRLQVTNRLQHLSAGFYSRHRMGDMLTRFTSDIPRLSDPLVETAAYSVYHAIFLSFTIVSMLVMSWQLSLLLFLIVPIYVLASRKMGPAIQVTNRARQERLSQLNSNLEEMLFGHNLVKAYGLGGHLMQRFRPKIYEYRKVAIWSDFIRLLYAELISTVDNVQTKLVFAVGGTLVVFGMMTTGVLVGFNTLMGRFLRPLHAFSSIYAKVAVAAASLRRVEEILREPMELMDTPPGGSYAPDGVRDAITFDHVSFSYTGATPTLSDINLRIPSGGKVAFVGPTGAGKSTLVNLIPRFYDVTEGAVLIDGQDTRSFALAGLRQSISIVSQDTFIFNTTILENIRFGRLDASDDEVVEAAKGAHLHSFIESLPAGYETLVGERGSRLSGGQKQRIAIARALLRDSPILILDEATSALDAETESEILAELDEVTQNKSVISITHRLGLAIKADTIYVLKDGRVVQQGSHEELMQQDGGLYRKLFEDQNRELVRRASGDQLEATVELVQQVAAVSMVPRVEVDRVAHLLTTERYPAGEVFCPRNGAKSKLYLLRSGQVEFVIQTEQEAEQRLQIGSPNGTNGSKPLSLLLNVPHSVSVQALTDTEVQVLHDGDLRALLAGDGRATNGSAKNGSSNGPAREEAPTLEPGGVAR
jgi:ABC-type multidrug transport system fused ATPase/permease subunit